MSIRPSGLVAGLSLRRMAGMFSPLVGSVVSGLPPRVGGKQLLSATGGHEFVFVL